MRFARVRSGLAESYEDATVLAIDSDGATLLSSGDPDAPLFYRSAIKPFQALAAYRAGLRLPDEHLAVTCSSHGGFPVHVALVRQILKEHALDEGDLLCPPSRPLSSVADTFASVRGNTRPSSVLHTCSGKHAGWLAACEEAGWDPKTYLDRDHPLQISIRNIMEELTGLDSEPAGVDACGAPTLRGSVRGLATAFIRLDTDEELAPISRAVTRFGALVADNLRADGRLSVWWTGPQKTGAEGLMAMSRGGIAIAAKSRSGRSGVAVAAVLVAAQQIGMLPPPAADALSPQISPPVMGHGKQVGQLELIEA